MDVIVRQAKTADVGIVYGLVQEMVAEQNLNEQFTNTSQDFEQDFESELFAATVAEVENEIVGCALYSKSFNYITEYVNFLHGLYIKSAWRGSDVERKLLQNIKEVAPEVPILIAFKTEDPARAPLLNCGDWINYSTIGLPNAIDVVMMRYQHEQQVLPGVVIMIAFKKDNPARAPLLNCGDWINYSAIGLYNAFDVLTMKYQHEQRQDLNGYTFRVGEERDRAEVYRLLLDMAAEEEIPARDFTNTEEAFLKAGESDWYDVMLLESSVEHGEGGKPSSRIAGMCLFSKWYNCVLGRTNFLSGLYIVPHYRGKGLSKSVIRATLNESHERGVDNFQLMVEKKNPVSQALWPKMGAVNHSLSEHEMEWHALFNRD